MPSLKVIFVAIVSCSLISCGAVHLSDNGGAPGVKKVIENNEVKNQNLVASDWKLVWFDEFDDTELDRTKWTPETSCWGGGNNEKQCYTDRPENIQIKNGLLKLIAKPEAFTGLAMPRDFDDRGAEITQPYTSGKIRTKGLASWTYGRFEARIKLPQGQGTWPAFWMMSEHDAYGGWPLSGEIDIVESVNLGARCSDCDGTDFENRSSAALHFGNEWPHNQFESTKAALDDITGFNTFAVEWSENRIDWFVNEDRVFSLSSEDWFSAAISKEENFRAPFDQPFYLMLNLAVGGKLSDTQNERGVNPNSFPNALIVDWVRVYER